jgi:fatty-acid desaturase
MRATEFVSESKMGKVSAQQQQSTVGLNVFTKKLDAYDRIYDLNRLMMAVACSDGINPIEMPAESWVGKHNTAHPYTQEEQDMLNLAYKAAGLEYKDLNKGDLDSEELKSTNTQSIVKPFKGYKRK